MISLVTFIQNREISAGWIPWYLLEPVVASILGGLMYFLMRGGVVSDVSSINPKGVAVVSALVGLFAQPAIEKLIRIFNVLFEPSDAKRR
jgi:hypothetical protein